MVIKIYKAFCKTTGKVYIGQTKRDLQTRINEHLNYSERKFSKALRKYGLDSFEWTILEEHNNIDKANEREVYLILKYNSYKEGYNSHIGGRVGGYTTKESIIKRQNTRARNGGYTTVSKNQKENNISKRPEVKNKIRKAITKLWNNKEYRDNQLKKREQNNPIVKCPFCKKEGRKQIMMRWHFEKCKLK